MDSERILKYIDMAKNNNISDMAKMMMINAKSDHISVLIYRNNVYYKYFSTEKCPLLEINNKINKVSYETGVLTPEPVNSVIIPITTLNKFIGCICLTSSKNSYSHIDEAMGIFLFVHIFLDVHKNDTTFVAIPFDESHQSNPLF